MHDAFYAMTSRMRSHYGHGALADAPDGVDLLQAARSNLLAKRRQVFNDSAERDGLELGLCEEVV